MARVLSRGDKLFGLIIGLWLAGATVAVFLLPPVVNLGYKARMLFFHIPMAWIAVVTFFMGAWWAFRYLRTRSLDRFYLSSLSNRIGLVFSFLATVSGIIYSKMTWYSEAPWTFWTWDVRQTTIFILLLIYTAYVVLGFSIENEETRATISSVYSLFSFATVPFLVFIIPRLYFSVHPDLTDNEGGLGSGLGFNMIIVLVIALVGITAFYVWMLRYGAAHRRSQIAELARIDAEEGSTRNGEESE
ncbi:MAG: cytochrome c biogenesis protein [Peptococcaceae bacterium]|nr:cytochrome c biogenesis protein [Peptococcaceae bacterium]